MAILMLVILIAFLIIAYFFGKRDLVSPLFLLCLILLVSFLIVLSNYSNWEVKINGYFVLYLSTAIVCFGLGAALVKAFFPKKVRAVNGLNKVPVSELDIPKKYPAWLLLFISLVLGSIYIYKLLSDAGTAASFSEKLRKIYDSIVYDDYSPGFIFNQMREIVTAIAYVGTYRLLIRIYKGRKDKTSIIALGLTILMLFAVALVTSDRNIFLRYAIFFVCLYVIFFYQNNKGKNSNFKIVARVVVIALIAFIIFFLFGKLKQYSSNINRVIGIYGGSGLYNFNLWIEDFDEPLTYGSSTFATFLNSVKSIFGSFGFDIEGIEIADRFDKFITFSSSNGYVYSSNIYSALKPFVQDFGYFGVMLFPFITGCFYQWLYLKMKNSNYGFAWLAYSMLIYPVIFYPIADQLFGRFNLGFVYEIVWLSIFYYLIFGKRKKHSKQYSSVGINKVADGK